jgi:hypothetical protein
VLPASPETPLPPLLLVLLIVSGTACKHQATTHPVSKCSPAHCQLLPCLVLRQATDVDDCQDQSSKQAGSLEDRQGCMLLDKVQAYTAHLARCSSLLSAPSSTCRIARPSDSVSGKAQGPVGAVDSMSQVWNGYAWPRATLTANATVACLVPYGGALCTLGGMNHGKRSLDDLM